MMSRTYTARISRTHGDTFATTTTSPRIKGQDGAGFADGTTVSWREWLVKSADDIRGWDDVGDSFSCHVAPNAAEKTAILTALGG